MKNNRQDELEKFSDGRNIFAWTVGKFSDGWKIFGWTDGKFLDEQSENCSNRRTENFRTDGRNFFGRMDGRKIIEGHQKKKEKEKKKKKRWSPITVITINDDQKKR